MRMICDILPQLYTYTQHNILYVGIYTPCRADIPIKDTRNSLYSPSTSLTTSYKLIYSSILNLILIHLFMKRRFLRIFHHSNNTYIYMNQRCGCNYIHVSIYIYIYMLTPNA